jgi:hypothetical protein
MADTITLLSHSHFVRAETLRAHHDFLCNATVAAAAAASSSSVPMAARVAVANLGVANSNLKRYDRNTNHNPIEIRITIQ